MIRIAIVEDDAAYLQQLTEYLRSAGFTAIEVFGDRSFRAPQPQEQRIYLKARKGKIK